MKKRNGNLNPNENIISHFTRNVKLIVINGDKIMIAYAVLIILILEMLANLYSLIGDFIQKVYVSTYE